MVRVQPAKSKGLNDMLPVGGEADVVVIGSGPAGIAASLAAKRKGAEVILVERFPFLGGENDNVATSKRYLFDPEALKYLYFDMLNQAGVKLRVNSLIVDTTVNKKRIEAVI